MALSVGLNDSNGLASGGDIRLEMDGRRVIFVDVVGDGGS